VAQLAEGRAKDDKNKLSSLKKDLGFGDQELQDWEKGYLSQQMKKKHYNFDSQKAREFFSFPKVKEGLLKLAAKLFGVEYLESTDSVWHEEVSVYWVIKGGQKIGKIFLDMHPREGKYKHAAVMPQKKGSRGKSVSEVALVCNFSKALIEHKQVVTFFHEFGHLMHAILGGGKNWARFSGIATEWDFVEVPSQLFEELAWDYDVLKEFAFHFETNEEIPKELVHNMKKANDFGKGIQVRQQMFYAMISLRFHQNPKENLLNILQETQKQFSPCPYISDTYFHLAFGHLIGYTAAYYTYMWSWAIALELLERFKTEGLLNSKTWNAYNEEILIPGGTKDATELIHNFLNRSHSLDGLKNWLKN